VAENAGGSLWETEIDGNEFVRSCHVPITNHRPLLTMTQATSPVSASPPPSPARGAGALPHRILYIDHTAAMGGGEVALLNLVSHLDRSRYVPVVLLLQDGPLRAKLLAAGIETHLYPVAGSVLGARKDSLGLKTLTQFRDVVQAARAVLGVCGWIGRLKVDLIHTNSLKADIIGGLAGRLRRKTVIWHIRDRIDVDYLPTPVVYAFRMLTKFVPSWVIANSGATLSTLRRRSRSSAAIPSGIAFDDSPVWSEDIALNAGGRIGGRTVLRVVHDGTTATPEQVAVALAPRDASSACRSEGPCVALVGRITRWKGQHVFLQAAAWVHRRFPEARFHIVGAALFDEKEYEAEVRELAVKLGVQNYVDFLGFRGDIAQYMGGIELLVHASITGEPFGQVIIEAMASGKPVVATNGGGVPEIVVHGETGLLVPMGNATAMADAICQILADPAAARRIGELGRQRVIEQFTIEHTVEKVQQVYDQLLAK
jgi:glycosyltransferase involved in cell wall biosynthesis